MTAAAVTLAAPAHADEYSFISDLDNNGIYYANVLEMIDVGKVTCHDMRAHMPLAGIRSALDRVGGWTNQESMVIMVAAANEMCPDVGRGFALRANQNPRSQVDRDCHQNNSIATVCILDVQCVGVIYHLLQLFLSRRQLEHPVVVGIGDVEVAVRIDRQPTGYLTPVNGSTRCPRVPAASTTTKKKSVT